MIRASRFTSIGVSARLLGTALLIAILFVAGCNTTSAPAISVTGATNQLDQGKTVTLTAAVSNDVNAGGVSWAIASNGPGTLTGQTATGVTYNAPATVTSVTTVVVTATSVADHTKTANFTITLQPSPQITTTTMPSGTVGTAYSHAVTMTGGVSPFTWTLIAGPAGLSLSNSTTSTVTVQGTPTTAGVNQTLTVKVTDAQGMSATSSGLTVTVYPALIITAPSLPVGIVGVSYTSPAFIASGGSGSGYTFAVASGSSAPLAIGASSGIITGTPTTAGTLQFTVKVTDSVSNTVTSSNLSITINAAITVGLSPASPVTLDQGKTQLVTATVGNDPNSAGVTWSAVTGLGSLTGSTSTTITYVAPGTVVAASTATFTATSVTDPTKVATYTIHLVPPPQITTAIMAAGNVNGAYSSPVSMTGGVGPYTWSFTALPAGLSLSSSTSNTVNVTGTPTSAGVNQTATIKVTDAQGLSSTSSGLTITIYPTLVITPPSLPVGVVGVSYTSPAFTASGGSGSGYTFAVASGSLAPLTIGASSGIVTGTPTTAGTLQFTVKVTDSVSNTVTSSNLSITINPAITVGLSPASPVTLDQGKTQLVTATVTNDPNSAGVTWSAVTGLGTLTGSTTTTVTYNAPALVASASTATFTATSVTDPTKVATYTIHLVPPPQITTTVMAAGNVNGAYSSPVSMTGGVAPYTWAIIATPTGLVLNGSTTSTVTVQGAPTVSGNGQTFTIKVTDAQGLSVTSSGLTIDIYAQLVLTSPSLPLPTGVQGLNYPSGETFTASGGSGTGYTWSLVTANSLPPGLALSSASGTSTSITTGPPTTAGTYPFSVKLMDSVGNTATTSGLSITINAPINVSLSPTQPFSMDQNTTQLITATANNDPSSAGVTWSSLTGAGSLSGSTSTTITYNAPVTISSTSIATFTATSVTDPTKSASFSVSLEPPPVIVTSSFATGSVGTSYSAPVTLNGGVGPYTWSFTALPAGLSLSSSTSSTVNVTGTPTTAGASQTVTIKVTDAKGLSNTLNSTITINAPSCTTNCTISGTVTGPWVSGITVSRSGSATTTTTDSSGNYSFTGLAGGTYTITPTLAGYNYTPATPSVPTVGSTTTRDFVASSAIPSFSISGTLSGSSTPGIVYISVSNCTNCNAIAGTTLASVTTNGGFYTVRGLSAGNYTVSAEIDTLNTGAPNESNPAGVISGVSITTVDVTGQNITINPRSPIAATAPNKPSVFPGNGSAFVNYKQIRDNNGEEIATSYKIYYGTDTAASNVGSVTIPAGDSNNVFVLSGLTNGTPYYFKMTALNSNVSGESPASQIFGPVTIGAPSGLNTVSGTITFSGITPPAGSALYVGVFSNTTGVYFERIANPSNPTQAYSVAGIPAGTYQNFAILDVSGTGFIRAGDVSNFGLNGPPALVVNTSISGHNITLVNVAAKTFISTSHDRPISGPDSYSINLSSDFGSKRPVSMTLFSGNNVAVPFDMVAQRNSGVSPIFSNAVRPLTTDSYGIMVSFSDASTPQNIPVTVSTVLDTFVASQAMNINSPNSNILPLLTWTAPSPLPASVYDYGVGLTLPGGNEFWNYNGGNNSNGIPSTQLSVPFNTDHSANPNSSLTPGLSYDWSVTVQDDNGNSATIHAPYVP